MGVGGELLDIGSQALLRCGGLKKSAAPQEPSAPRAQKDGGQEKQPPDLFLLHTMRPHLCDVITAYHTTEILKILECFLKFI